MMFVIENGLSPQDENVQTWSMRKVFAFLSGSDVSEAPRLNSLLSQTLLSLLYFRWNIILERPERVGTFFHKKIYLHYQFSTRFLYNIISRRSTK